jgi:23S rRNA pseudouridine1911/1915/1917 synthase
VPPATGSSASGRRRRHPAAAERGPAGAGRRPRLLRVRVGERQAGRRLDDVVGEWLTSALGTAPSRAAVRRLIMAGALRRHGRPLRAPARMVEAGAVFEIALRPDLVRRAPVPGALDASRILYEDDALIVVDKPPGLPTVATADPTRPHLVGLVEGFLRARGGDRAASRLGVHQRLDRDTSGVVLFAKDPAASPGLAAQFAEHAVEKTYLALTARPSRLPPRSWRADEDVDTPEARAVRGPRPAVTDFAVVETLARGLVVEARPRTGRKHQIRIHLSRAGLPILGDAVHGGEARAAARVMLHAARLELRHPLTGAPLSVASPLPADFRAARERLGRAEPPPRRGRRRRG